MTKMTMIIKAYNNDSQELNSPRILPSCIHMRIGITKSGKYPKTPLKISDKIHKNEEFNQYLAYAENPKKK